MVLLGLEAPEEDLAQAFALARDCSLVKGFAVGRTIFVEPAVEWFAGRIDDARRSSAWRARSRAWATSGALRATRVNDAASDDWIAAGDEY